MYICIYMQYIYVYIYVYICIYVYMCFRLPRHASIRSTAERITLWARLVRSTLPCVLYGAVFFLYFL